MVHLLIPSEHHTFSAGNASLQLLVAGLITAILTPKYIGIIIHLDLSL